MCLKGMALSLLMASTHHIGGDFNETHNGIGLELPIECNTSAVVGTYENSYYERTYYAGVATEKPIKPWLRLGWVVTGVTGYRETPILAAVTARVGNDDLGARLLHLPGAVTALQVRVGF